MRGEEFWLIATGVPQKLKDVDPTLFVASGVVAFDLEMEFVKWRTHLDLSTDHSKFRCASYHQGISRRKGMGVPIHGG